jgi:S-adenosylmethionine-dependent methyltransferase
VQLSAERFQEADKYAAFLRTTEGRLRLDLGWANLRGFLPANAPNCRALDIGGGSGAIALRLSDLGFQVALLDVSEAMLALARKEANASESKGRIAFQLGDATRLPELFRPCSFDAIICHNLLEYMEDPLAMLRGLESLVKQDRQSVVSLLVRNRWGEVVKAALKAHDLERAATALRADTVLDSLYGQPVRMFDPEAFREMVEQAGLEILAARGVRVLSDYLECNSLTESAYKQLLEFELLLGAQPQLAAIARYWQIIARPASQLRGKKRR